MVIVSPSPPADAVRQGAAHTLFVEGNTPETIDPEALKILFADTSVTVRPLGPALNIRSVAEALHRYHKDYYFLIDRDHHDDKTVEKSWQNFPDKNTHNLLIWKKRELENYFLDPEYLVKSTFAICDQKAIEKAICSAAAINVFRDAANLAIVGTREQLKETWIETFIKTAGFENRTKAIKTLQAMTDFSNKIKSVKESLRKGEICTRFEKIADELLDGAASPQIGVGNWINRLRGKDILPSVINQCCKVRDSKNTVIQGRQAVVEIAKDLMRKPLADQPQDFRELHRLIVERIANS